MSPQAPNAVVLIRPHHFGPNPQTNADNAFQSWDYWAGVDVAKAAYEASTLVARQLQDAGVTVHIFEDTSTDHPDSVFPNNWFSTHAGGRVALYPMYAPNRRGERRSDVIDFLKKHYRVQDVIDYSGLEEDGIYLEGTGTMVLDHISRIAYTARSLRADPLALERFCTQFGYEPMFFDAADAHGNAIYHTNILMCIGTEIALVGLDAITSTTRRHEVAQRIEDSGRTVIALSHSQLADFAGNAIELRAKDGHKILAMSSRGVASLTNEQRKQTEKVCELLPLDVAPIELAGGSVRCMIAGIHLDRRPTPAVPPARTTGVIADFAAA